MSEQKQNEKTIRPTKKQRELLDFIDSFIKEHRYSPSYREIMSGLRYTSVATVALHVNSLIKRGHLIKRTGKARSLEVVTQQAVDPDAEHKRWLNSKINTYLRSVDEKQQEKEGADIKTLLEKLGINGSPPPRG